MISVVEPVSTPLPKLKYQPGSTADHFVEYSERLKEACYMRFGYLGHIVAKGQYYTPPAIPIPTVQEVEANPFAKDLYMEAYRERRKIIASMEEKKLGCYQLIWSTLSTESRAKLRQRPDFVTKVEHDMDPLELWKAIEAVHLVAATGSAAHDISRAREIYDGLRQRRAESLAEFKLRTDTALRSLKIAKATVPNNQEQALDFLRRLDQDRFVQLTVQLRNNELMGFGTYPADLTATYDVASEFQVVSSMHTVPVDAHSAP